MTNSRVMIIGKMTSGKTTLATHLVENFGFKKLALADKLKEIVNAFDQPNMTTQKIIQTFVSRYIHLTDAEYQNLVYAIDNTRRIPDEKPKPRRRLQYLGTEGGRKTVRNTIWIDILTAQLKPYGRYVIDDVRFPNEFQAFYNIGFTPVKLVVSPETQEERLVRLYGNYDPAILKHDSETGYDLIKVDLRYQINNDGPLDHLYHYADLILGL